MSARTGPNGKPPVVGIVGIDGAYGRWFARFFRETPTAATTFRASAPADAPLTQPYWLAQPRQGDLFTWRDGSPKSAPPWQRRVASRLYVRPGRGTGSTSR